MTALEWLESLSPWPRDGFDLTRMHALLAELGDPQLAFPSLHVVGTNGKSTTTRTIEETLLKEGVPTGAYTSPHVTGWAERIRVGGAEVDAERVLARVRAPAVALGATQFEALTAAAYSELARRGVEAAVIEAGLGGRYDATNVIPSRVQVLTSVGLEHTRWLGPTIGHIAAEKLDVVRDGGTLVLGHGLHPGALEVAKRVASERGARIVNAPEDPGVAVAALGSFQRRNFALARAAAEAYLGALDERALVDAAAHTRVPGRLQIVARDPLTLLDGAHNPEGVAALVESLAEPFAAGRSPLVAVVSILDDKDAAGMLSALLPVCDALVCTNSHNPRALPAPTLQSLARQLDGPPAEVLGDPPAALEHARDLAGPRGIVLATGSIYLVADLLAPHRRARASNL